MKKLVLIAFALIVSTVAFSQVEKGDITGTANVSFSSLKPEEGDAINMALFNVRAGYFFTNNIEAGLTLQITNAAETTSTGIGPYAVYNFLTADAKLLPYVGANFLNYNMGVEGVDPINQLGGFGGAKYFITEAVNIDASLNYTTWLGDISGSSFTFNLGIGLNLGALK
jgi:outer membrane protein W